MTKFLAAAALLSAGLCLPAVLRADDDDAPAPASTTPDAAAAARDKGYRAEEADKASAPNEEESAPVERHADKRAITPAAQRALGGSGRSVSATGSGGGASGSGVACEDSVPKLAGVQRKEIDLEKTLSAPVTSWSVPPNGAVSYKFKTPAAGAFTLFSTSGGQARPVATLQNVSETPCDFNVDKARKGADLCYGWGPVENGIIFLVGGGKGKACTLKPNTVYYYNIRSLSNPDQGEARDACADEIPFFKSRPDLKAVCGGIWKLSGSVAPAAK